MDPVTGEEYGPCFLCGTVTWMAKGSILCEDCETEQEETRSRGELMFILGRQDISFHPHASHSQLLKLVNAALDVS